MALQIIRLNTRKTMEKRRLTTNMLNTDSYKIIRSPHAYKDSRFTIYLLFIHFYKPGCRIHPGHPADSSTAGTEKEFPAVSGLSIKSDRPIVDDSFDLGIAMTFRSVDDMNQYLIDPRHTKFVDTWLKGRLDKMLVYDF